MMRPVQNFGRWVLAGSAALVFLSSVPGVAAGDNEYVRVTTAVSRQHVAAGDTAAILVYLEPRQGIHINAEPPVAVELDSGRVTVKGTPRTAKDTATGYLASTAPVVQTVLIPPTAAPGTVTVEGRVVYYYCSDEEGWCMRHRQPFSVAITVVSPRTRRP